MTKILFHEMLWLPNKNVLHSWGKNSKVFQISRLVGFSSTSHLMGNPAECLTWTKSFQPSAPCAPGNPKMTKLLPWDEYVLCFNYWLWANQSCWTVSLLKTLTFK